MIVLSFLLVLVAAVTLIIGLFQDTLVWIWTSIGSCVVAMVFLGIGVLQRRSTKPAAEGADSGYGPGAISGLLRDESDEEAPEAKEDEDVTVVPKRQAAEVQEVEEDQEAEAVPAARGSSAKAEAPGEAVEDEEPALEEPAAAAHAPQEASGATTGAAARSRLDEVKGLGRAKQDALLDRFGSLEAIREASVDDLKQVKGFGSATAEQVHGQLAAVGDGEAPQKKAAKKSAKKSAKKTTKKTAKKTTGAAARKRLAEVKGLGPAKQKALLDRFGSLEAIRDADVSDLQQVKGVGEATAHEIRSQLS